MKTLLTTLVLCLALVFSVQAAENTKEKTSIESTSIQFLDHLTRVNQVMCEIMVKCKPGKTVEKCKAELDEISKANPNNANIMVKTDVSEKCVAKLKNESCDTIMAKSIEDECALTALKMADEKAAK